MNTIYSALISFVLLLSLAGSALSQTPSDAIMMKKWQACLALVYEHSQFDEYWEGTFLRENGTIATVHRNSISPMLALGVLSDRLNLLVGVPYVQTESSEPNGGKFVGAKGFQDLSIALKGKLLHQQVGPGNLIFLTTAGFSTPITNYLSDYRPYSIGFGAIEYNLRGIFQYTLKNGLHIRGSLAHLWRTETEAERDYYYNNGSYYTSFMDVPNAWNYNAVIGKWMLDNTLRFEVNYSGLRSTSGDDIRKYNAAQPTNKVDFDQLGIVGQYYIKQLGGVTVLAFYTYTVNGRNVGKTSHFGGGLTYVFNLKKETEPKQ